LELEETLTRLPATPAEGREWQESLAPRVVLDGLLTPPEIVLGLDCAGPPRGADGRIRAAGVVVTSSGEMLEERVCEVDVTFPYVPGLLALREAPALFEVLRALESRVDAIFVDGHGILHPRRFGIACLVGLATAIPTVGVAKQPFGASFVEPAVEPGSISPLQLAGSVVGVALRTRRGSRPVFVSPGHLISAEASAAATLAFVARGRLPEPTRLADRLASGRRG
jgi:deoxyribonuclease V